MWHQFTVLVDDDAPVDRDELAERLSQNDIGSGVYYPKTVYDYDCYRDHPRVVIEDTPVATSVAARCLSIPVHARLSASDIDKIVDTVRNIMGA